MIHEWNWDQRSQLALMNGAVLEDLLGGRLQQAELAVLLTQPKSSPLLRGWGTCDD